MKENTLLQILQTHIFIINTSKYETHNGSSVKSWDSSKFG